MLKTDSWMFALQNDWAYPLNKSEMILMDLWDLTLIANAGKKAKTSDRYKRPYKTEEEKKQSYLNGKYGNTKNIKPETIKEYLASLGHHNKEK